MVRKAEIQDVATIRSLISMYSEKGEMLPKALMEIYEELRDFYVYADEDDEVLGCCALHLFWEDLAEIRSLAVKEPSTGQGIGAALVDACLDEAREFGIASVVCRFTLTKKSSGPVWKFIAILFLSTSGYPAVFGATRPGRFKNPLLYDSNPPGQTQASLHAILARTAAE